MTKMKSFKRMQRDIYNKNKKISQKMQGKLSHLNT